MNPNEHRINELAYQIWESEGRPHGQAARHWDIACKLAAEDIESGFGNPGFDSPAQVVSETPKARKSAARKDVTQQQAESKPAKTPRKPAKSKSDAPQMN